MDYPCMIFSQRKEPQAPKFCIFQAPVSEVIQWSTIPTLNPENQDGIQRPIKDNKVKAIKNFFASDIRNTIPTAIVMTLSDTACKINSTPDSPISTITINEENKENIFIIDGQHRLYGLANFDESARVPIVAILNATSEERAFQFIIINNKVTKIAPDHIRALTLKFTNKEDETGLEERLKSSRLSLSPNLSYVGWANDLDESPFKGMIALPNIEKDERKVVPAAIETSIAYIQSKNINELSSEDSAYDFFMTIWTVIREKWTNSFPNEEKLMSKAGIVSMTRYITDAINFISGYPGSEIDLANPDSVAEAVKNVLKTQSEEFWLSDWDIQISDNRTVRDTIQEALRTIHQNIRNKQNWFNEVSFVRPKLP